MFCCIYMYEDIKLLESVERRATNKRVSFKRGIEVCGKVLVAI